MYVRPVSDLHNDCIPWSVPFLSSDADTVLVLAGDIDMRARSADWMATFAPRFKAIVMVLGNHDYWKDSLDVAPRRLKQRVAELGLANVFILDKDTVVVDDDVCPVRFVGATLWTDFANADPLAMYDAAQTMKDYKKIRYQAGRTNLHTRTILNQHYVEKQYLYETLQTPFDGHTVVVTHHAPSYQSVAPQYRTAGQRYSNAAYHSSLDDWARPLAFTYWFHGHTHSNFDYEFGLGGRVLCNPRGYAPSDLNPGFNPELCLDMTVLQPVLLPKTAEFLPVDYASWWESNHDTSR